jgi:hypothetical protein
MPTKKLKQPKASPPPQHGSLLSTDEVCRIIAACGANSVLSLKYRGLELDLKGKKRLPQVIEKFVNERALDNARTDAESLLKEAQLEHLRLSDPVEFERAVLEGRISDAPEDNGIPS